MDDHNPREPAVFVVTIRTGSEGEAAHGCIAPVVPAGASPSPKRWFLSLEQIPAIIRSFLNRQGPTGTEAETRRTQ